MILGTVALLLCACVPAHAQKTQQERELFKQLNNQREEAGAPPLQWDEKLAQAARQHSQKMATKNELAHVMPGEPSVPDRLAATGVHFNRSGENVGYNSDFNDITRAFMESPPHRKNMLNPDYNLVGIGVAQSSNGMYYATQDFAHGIPKRTAAQAEDLAANSFEQLRKKEGQRPVDRVNNADMRKLACTMAQSGKLDPRKVLNVPGVHEALVYNNSLPEVLPNSARAIARHKRYSTFAVGACFTESHADNPGGTFYVVMAFY